MFSVQSWQGKTLLTAVSVYHEGIIIMTNIVSSTASQPRAKGVRHIKSKAHTHNADSKRSTKDNACIYFNYA